MSEHLTQTDYNQIAKEAEENDLTIEVCLTILDQNLHKIKQYIEEIGIINLSPTQLQSLLNYTIRSDSYIRDYYFNHLINFDILDWNIRCFSKTKIIEYLQRINNMNPNRIQKCGEPVCPKCHFDANHWHVCNNATKDRDSYREYVCLLCEHNWKVYGKEKDGL